MYRLRIRYHKTGRVRFVAHLEMVRFMERVFRRMDLPLAFTQGFNPHPRISFAAPLSVGVESLAEYLDVELTEQMPEAEILKRSEAALPEGFRFVSAQYVEDKRSLMSLMAWADYRVWPEAGWTAEALGAAVKTLLDRESVIVEKRGGKNSGKPVEIRPQIRQLNVASVEGSPVLVMTLMSGSNGSLKPELVVEALAQGTELPGGVDRVLRTELYTAEGDRLIPIQELK